MRLIQGLPEEVYPFKNPALTIGNFDGVHVGHQEIFRSVIKKARELDGTSVVITFDPHPLKVLSKGGCPPLINTFREKVELLKDMGIDVLICLHFDSSFAGLKPVDFVKKLLIDKLGIKALYVGYDFAFGREREGNINLLKELGQEKGFEVIIVDPVAVDGKVVSSTSIREIIRAGDVENASQYLGRLYSLRGRVIRGEGRGRGLGFPTANLEVSDQLIPGDGVYLGHSLVKGEKLLSLINIGSDPTFDNACLSVESHILDFDQDIYEELIDLMFIKKMRDEKKFDSIDKLVAQMKTDLDMARRYFDKE